MKNLVVTPEKSLIFNETTQPEILQHQCLVKVNAFGINRADLLQKAGLYPPPQGESDILGLEVSGEIIALGTNVLDKQIGDKVFGLVAGGGYSQYVAVNAEHLIALPSNFNHQQGAATAEVFLTAYQALFTIGKLQQGEKVLVHAGASGVGTAAIQLAKAKGCFVVATCGSENKVKACLELGADIALNYHDESFVSWQKEHLPSGFNVIVDVVAGSYVNDNIKTSALDGRIIVLAILGGRFAEQLDIARMLQKRVSISASTLRNRTDEYKCQLVSDFTEEFFEHLASGEITPLIDTAASWNEIELLHQKMATNSNIGKLVAIISD